MATLTVDDGSNGIAAVTMVAATGGGDSVGAGFRGGGWDLPVLLVVRNGHTVAQTVTVAGITSPFSVPANGGVCVIPVRGDTYFGSSRAITYSGVTALTVGAVRLAAL